MVVRDTVFLPLIKYWQPCRFPIDPLRTGLRRRARKGLLTKNTKSITDDFHTLLACQNFAQATKKFRFVVRQILWPDLQVACVLPLIFWPLPPDGYALPLLIYDACALLMRRGQVQRSSGFQGSAIGFVKQRPFVQRAPKVPAIYPIPHAGWAHLLI